ncbi:hypothetical protein RUND412_008725 [Rhizina undulata]
MKYSFTSFVALALGASTATAAAISKRDTLPSSFTLDSSTDGLISGFLWSSLMYANSSAYIGNIKYSVYSEPLELSAYGAFTSIHVTPTGWQNLYVYTNESQPIGFTTPHSAYVPNGATTAGLGESSGKFTWDGEQKWKACRVPEDTVDGTYQIYWDGADSLTDCVSVTLTVSAATC